MTNAHANRVIDARNLEPPEPFVRTMEALEGIGIDENLLLLLTREPYPLYRTLELNGFTWQTDLKPDGVVEILIWRKSQ
ncbi:MAG: DUF2249 domain-containing protein [bacterium]